MEKEPKDLSAGQMMLFQEVCGDLRSTESRHLQIGLGYLGAFALGLSILASPRPSPSTAVSRDAVMAYGAFAVTGCVVVFMMDAYRGWKQHYKMVACVLARELGLYERPHALPMWLRYPPYDSPEFHPSQRRTKRLSVDNALTYFIGVVATPGAFAFMSLGLIDRGVTPLLAWLPEVVYAIYLGWLRKRVAYRVERLRSATTANTVSRTMP
jgi:hypothetical protein